jgi:cytochrome c-type biogenesis protein CcmH/NrfG
MPEGRSHGVRFAARVLAFGVFTCAGAALNASPARLSSRLEDVGEYVFRTYYAGSSHLINVAQSEEPDTARQIARREATIERLQPLGPGDAEYTHLLTRIVELHRRRGDHAVTVHWMERAAKIDPDNDDLALRLADGYIMVGDPGRARTLTNSVLTRDPNRVDALVLRAMAAIHERSLDQARADLERAHWLRPDDPLISTWLADVDRQIAARPR